MPIRTGSVLEKLAADVDKHRGRVKRARARVELLRQEYRYTASSEQRKVEARGHLAAEALAKAEAELDAAIEALASEEARLLQPGSFLWFV